MCTVTIVMPNDEQTRWRMVCNRDESPLRPAARPPEARGDDRLRYVMPVDPESGGTWIAASSAGLVLTLLNANASPPRRVERPVSRGTIIPRLIQGRHVDEVIALARHLDPTEFAPFRVVGADQQHLAEIRSDGAVLTTTRKPLGTAPLMWASSGLGDARVDAPRRGLFDEMFSNVPRAASRQRQDAFHRHRWPDRPELSICMQRDEARTVSLTEVDRQSDRIVMRYHPAAPDHPAQDHRIDLHLDHAGRIDEHRPCA
ncbi:MAG: hypothetical protein CMJ18_24185 [Phycisphaeraceae bacterium]|nr:hypothetical protein [Phycisphaeraceae bacterium]